MREVEWQWDILQWFNNLLLLYDSVIRDKLSFVTLIGLQVRRAIHEEKDACRGAVIEQISQMKVSAPTHSSTLHHCTFIHHATDVLPSDCCPISTSLYRTPCIVIATAGIVVYLNYKKLRYEWERLNYPVVPTPVHLTVNKLNVPVILSFEIPSVQYRWHNSRLNNVSSKSLCRCKCIYRQMGVCTFINSMFSPTGKTETEGKWVHIHNAEVWKIARRFEKKNNWFKNRSGELYLRWLHNPIHIAIPLSLLFNRGKTWLFACT